MAGKYSKKKDNLWILFNGKEYCVGLINETQEELGDIAFTNLPKVRQSLEKNEPLIEAEVEKAVNELVSPLTDTVSPTNDRIGKNINILNDPDEMNTWISSFKDVDPKEFDEL